MTWNRDTFERQYLNKAQKVNTSIVFYNEVETTASIGITVLAVKSGNGLMDRTVSDRTQTKSGNDAMGRQSLFFRSS
jgi:hypothetical protein